MFSTNDLFVNSIIPLILVIASGVLMFIESLISDKKLISPWISIGVCAICTGILIYLQATLADILIYLVSVLAIRLVINFIKMKKGKEKNDI